MRAGGLCSHSEPMLWDLHSNKLRCFRFRCAPQVAGNRVKGLLALTSPAPAPAPKYTEEFASRNLSSLVLTTFCLVSNERTHPPRTHVAAPAILSEHSSKNESARSVTIPQRSACDLLPNCTTYLHAPGRILRCTGSLPPPTAPYCHH